MGRHAGFLLNQLVAVRFSVANVLLNSRVKVLVNRGLIKNPEILEGLDIPQSHSVRKDEP